MGLRYPDQIYFQWFFITTTFKDWERFGNLSGFYGQLCDSLRIYSEKYAAGLCAYVLMPHHIHFVINIDGIALGNYMRDFKKYISQKVATEYGIQGGVWMPGYDRVVIESEAVMRTKIQYIHNNPVKAKLVIKAEDWPWSSAGDYFLETPGPVPIFKAWG